jgi:hypothetical protein
LELSQLDHDVVIFELLSWQKEVDKKKAKSRGKEGFDLISVSWGLVAVKDDKRKMKCCSVRY